MHRVYVHGQDKILVIIYTMLKENTVYDEEIFKDIQVRLSENRDKKLILELQKRGYKVEPLIA